MNSNIPWDSLTAHFKGTASTEQMLQVRAWIQDAHNLALYEQLEELWHTLGSDSSYDPDADTAWAKVHAQAMAGSRPDRRHRGIRRIALAAASVAAAIAVFVCGFTISQKLDSVRPEPLGITSYTALTGKSRMSLSDGTQICLRSGSTISLPESADREVVLVGDAYFDVAKDSERTFRVKVGEVDICVHGTSFNVRSDEQGEMVYVSLLEGSVSLESALAGMKLHPGETAQCSADGSLTKVSQNLQRETCWTEDALQFDSLTLGEICLYLERWFDCRIEVSPDVATRYRYTFSLRDESLMDIVDKMARINPLQYEFQDDRLVILPGRRNRNH